MVSQLVIIQMHKNRRFRCEVTEQPMVVIVKNAKSQVRKHHQDITTKFNRHSF